MSLEYIISVKDDFSSGFSELENRITESAASFKAVGTAAMGFGVAVGGGLAVAVKTAAGFEQSMSRVSALSGAVGEDFDALRDQALKLGAATQFSASEAAEGQAFLAMAGYNTQEMLAAMPGLLNTAAAAQIDLGTASDIVSNILSGFGIEAAETARVADVLTATFTSANVDLNMLGESMKMAAPVANTLGVSIEDTAAAMGMLGNAGIQGSMAGRGLAAILNRLASQPAPVQKALEDMGVSVFDSSGEFIGLEDTLRKVGDGMKSFTQQQKAAALAAIGGQEHVKTLSVLLDAGADAFGNYSGELENSLGAAQAVAETQTDNFSGAITRLKSAFEGLMIAIGTPLIEPLTALAEWIAVLLQRFTELSPETQKMITYGAALTAGISTLGGAFLLVVGFIPQIIAGFKALSPIFALVARAIPIVAVLSLVTAIGTLLWKNEEARAVIISVWEAIKSAFSAAWEFIKPLLAAFGEFMLNVFQEISAWISENWPAIWEGIKTAASAAWGFLRPIFQAIGKFFSKVFTKIYDWVKDNWPSIWSGIKDAVRAAWDYVKPIVTEVGSFISDTFNALWALAKDLWPMISGFVVVAWNVIWDIVKTVTSIVWPIIRTFLNNIVSIFKSIWAAVELVVKTAWGAMKLIVVTAIDIIHAIIKTTMALIQGDWEGAWDAIWGFIKRTGGRIWEFITNLFDDIGQFLGSLISNFYDIGKNIINGLADGIKAAGRAAMDAAKRVAANVKDAVTGFFSIKSPSRVMMEVGGFITEGLGAGMMEDVRRLTDAAKTVSGAAMGEFNVNRPAANTIADTGGSNRGGRGIVVYNTFNIDADVIDDAGFQRFAKRVGDVIADGIGGTY